MFDKELEEKTKKEYKSEKEFLLNLCDTIEDSIFKQVADEDRGEFEELMRSIWKEYQIRYPEVKSKLITL